VNLLTTLEIFYANLNERIHSINMLNLFSGSSAKRFRVLVMGQRSAGKTVFLAGSYAALRDLSQRERGPLWFDCQTDQAKANIEAILKYVARSGEYPPATMTMREFDFSLKRRLLLGSQTLCHFGWNDIPGEICNPENDSFREIVLSSHSCCFFIDGYSLIKEDGYINRLDELINQVKIIATLAYLNKQSYSFALIVTKTDLIDSDLDEADWQKRFEESLQPLFDELEDGKAKYKVFYSAVLVASGTGSKTLKTNGGAAPILWLINELVKAHNGNAGLRNYLLDFIVRLSRRKEALQEPVGLGDVFQNDSPK
jgi:Double-GTPase 2